MIRRRHAWPLLAALAAPGSLRAQEAPLVFAAASLQDALRALSRDWASHGAALGHAAPRFAFAASSALARQIEQGAPADIFMSADEAWMDYLQQRGLIVATTRVSPVGNALVLVAPAGQGRDVTLRRGTDLLALLGPGGRLATGDPAHVPVGRYAQAALEWLGQWPALAPRLARADNVRAALLLVERGEAPLGIVYATDVVGQAGGARIIGSFPPESHPPIRYPFALTRRGTGQHQALLDFLTGTAAAPVWRRFGFTLAQ